jgi:V/A-type H+/Na+-transporting ATPase subunit F
MKLCCLADEDTVRGFRLAGVPARVVVSASEAAAALQRALEQPDCGIIILTEAVAAGIRSQVDAIRLEREQPLVVEIPGPLGPMPGRKSLRQVLQEAVGVRLGTEESG